MVLLNLIGFEGDLQVRKNSLHHLLLALKSA
jgi:hypothetical protein